ncbi:MAG: ribonuclease D [Propionibacterium sp.]|nr:MAG: ribonuclease D [Propionibacterium sp.]
MVFVSAPAGGPVAVIDTPEQLANATAKMAHTDDEFVAVDAERAQSFRYSARAYLFQFRTGGETYLIDPVACEGQLAGLNRACAPKTWLLHAASQDLPCLAEAGLYPDTLFDTELAGRLLNYPRDVEFLHQLRSKLWQQLQDAGKDEWAIQEFSHVRQTFAEPATPLAEPWRKLKGLRDVRTQQGLAVVAELWAERDAIAEELDLAPTRLLKSTAITELAALVTGREPVSVDEALRNVAGFRYRHARRYTPDWKAAILDGLETPASEQPALRPPRSGPGKPHSWQRNWPDAFERWQRLRAGAVETAETLEVPPEQLIAPSSLQAVAWEPPSTPDTLSAKLTELRVRPWQKEYLIPVFAEELF